MLLLLPVHYVGPENSVGGGCCVAAVSRAFAIPIPLSAPFVDLAAQVLGQSCELLEAYVQAAADVASRDDGSAPAAAAVAHTVLAIVIRSAAPCCPHALTLPFTQGSPPFS
jgi:hypothetical protein